MRLDRQALSDMNYQTTSRIRPILPGGNSSFCHDPTELLLESAETTQTPEKELFCGETTSGRHGAGLETSFEMYFSTDTVDPRTKNPGSSPCAVRAVVPGLGCHDRERVVSCVNPTPKYFVAELSTSHAKRGSHRRGSGPSRGALLRRGTCRGGGRR